MRDPDIEQKLERFIDRALRQQTLLRAPASLQSRVLSELARRAALPWWRCSFSHWPMAAKAAFFAACAALIKLAFSGTGWVLGAAAAPAASVRSTAEVASSLGSATRLIVESIPTYWIYLGAGFAAVLYLALFGLGATAYRTLYK